MIDTKFMLIAIEEAKRGIGRTSPNPAVGAVIVKEGRVIGKGYHKKAGTPHAEIHAISNATENLTGATIYVTLEPCSHTGKTPPCCEAIARAGISRVVVGMTDPNPLVNGRGLSYLRERGIKVVSGILEEESQNINLPFIKFIQTSLPYMVMKAGVSLDGRLNYQYRVPGPITGDETRCKVHQLRDRFDSIMVGSKTIIADDPSLTTRLDVADQRDPMRIIVDSKLVTPLSSKVYTQESAAKICVVCSKNALFERRKAFENHGVNVVSVDENNKGLSLKQAMIQIARMGVCSVLVEGGSGLHGSLLANGLYDYAYLFYGPVFAGDSGQSLVAEMNVQSPKFAPRIDRPQYETFGEDMLVSGKIVYPPEN